MLAFLPTRGRALPARPHALATRYDHPSGAGERPRHLRAVRYGQGRSGAPTLALQFHGHARSGPRGAHHGRGHL